MTMLRFTGYAALFDRVDEGGDVIRRGAFGALPDGERLPLLWQHRPDRRIGWVTMAREDDRGLRVLGCLPEENRAADMLRQGAVRGLSFGYRVERSEGFGPRALLALDIAEISLVTHPMQPGAQVHFLSSHPPKHIPQGKVDYDDFPQRPGI